MLISLLSQPDLLIFFLIAIIIAITVHEFSHAWMANFLGDPTAKFSGRLTLNPISHLDPLGTIMILLVGLGWGRPVPYNPNFVKRGKFGEALIALAGPLSNILVAVVFALSNRIYYMINNSYLEGQLFTFLSVVIVMNIILAAFNLLPIPPLDGSKLLYFILDKLSFSPASWWARFERMGPMIILAIIFAERMFHINIIWRILDPFIFLMGLITGGNIFSIF